MVLCDKCRSLICGLVFWLTISANCCVSLLAQERNLRREDGFARYEGQHIRIVTDLDLGDELAELASAYDLAIDQWCRVFSMDPLQVANWKVTAYVMGARERFLASGMLPKSLPNFPHGYQSQDEVWIVNQPSTYYRRHLLLHEGTHWFMVRKNGSAGPPWLMEGIAEWLATHRWQAGQLTMGIVPKSKNDVPYWGRITLIQEQMNTGVAPSLETILRYGNTAHQQLDAYAWSWAAVHFLRACPDSSAAFQQLLDGQSKSDRGATRMLFEKLRTKWPVIRAQWMAFSSEMEYGFDPQAMPSLTKAVPLTKQHRFAIDSKRGWQSAGVVVKSGQKFSISASGRYIVGTDPKPWLCEPQGVTIEYFRDQPLGKLLMTLLHQIDDEPESTESLRSVPVGEAANIRASTAGELFFKINETYSGLADNSGQIAITLIPE